MKLRVPPYARKLGIWSKFGWICYALRAPHRGTRNSELGWKLIGYAVVAAGFGESTKPGKDGKLGKLLG